MSGVVWHRRWAATAGLGLLVVATATASATTARSTAWKPSLAADWRAGGRLIEAWDGDKLWMMNADGTRRRPVARYYEDGFGGASLSQSGRLVGVTNATTSGLGLLVLKRTGGRTIKRFRWRTGPTSGLGNPVWAPDDRAVAVEEGPDEEPRISVWDLGTGVRSVSRGSPEDTSPDWSPDGGRIAFIGCPTDAKCHLAVMARDASHRRVIRNIDRPGYLLQPSWSPDGRAIALALPFGPPEESTTVPEPQRFGIYLVRPDGSGFRRIAVTKPTRYSPIPLAWSRDSRRIVFSDTSGIWVAGVTSREKHRLTWMSGGEDVLSTVSWAPSAWILFIHRGDVYKLLPGRRPVRVTN